MFWNSAFRGRWRRVCDDRHELVWGSHQVPIAKVPGFVEDMSGKFDGWTKFFDPVMILVRCAFILDSFGELVRAAASKFVLVGSKM